MLVSLDAGVRQHDDVGAPEELVLRGLYHWMLACASMTVLVYLKIWASGGNA